MVLISTTVDGADHADEVEPRLLLVHYLRTRLGRTGLVPARANSALDRGALDRGVTPRRCARC
ncbi:MAG TPA: hypothetical protein VHS32_02655 [Streptosporangiaceae bacterium]|nr:hypothetical protein [Streptosporangiaceae bacterium]